MLEQSRSQIQSIYIKAIALTERRRKKQTQDKTKLRIGRTGDLFRQDNHSSKELVWNLPGKKEDRTNPSKVNVRCCFSSQDFGGIVCFK